jgi:hypothetical protein
MLLVKTETRSAYATARAAYEEWCETNLPLDDDDSRQCDCFRDIYLYYKLCCSFGSVTALVTFICILIRAARSAV